MYHVVLGLLIVGAIIEYLQNRTPNRLYIFSVIVLVAMLCLRYGQGTDYFGYYYLYANIPTGADFKTLSTISLHGEIGWKIICSLLKSVNMSYPLYIGLWSALEMYLLIRFINKFCPKKMIALLLAYHTLYLTYLFSAIRQGMVICIFLGVMLEPLLERKYKKYILYALLSSVLHSSALILLILPLSFKIKQRSNKSTILIVCACWMVGFVLYMLNGVSIVKALFPIIRLLGDGSISWIALFERMFTYIILLYVQKFYMLRNPSDQNSRIYCLWKIYSFGMMVYGLTIWAPGFASRMMFFFKVLEVAIVSVFLMDRGKVKQILAFYAIVLCAVLYFKNIDSYIAQGDYYNHVSVTNYPYISIFEQDEVFDYRRIDYDVSEFG